MLRGNNSKEIVLKQLLNNNKISISKLAKELYFCRSYLSSAIYGNVDFKLEDLHKIKDYLVEKNIIPSDYDIGCLLDYVEETKEQKN